MRREEGNRALPHIVWNACSNAEFVKGAKRTTSLTWSQLCLFLAQLVCCRRYICSELLSSKLKCQSVSAFFRSYISNAGHTLRNSAVLLPQFYLRFFSYVATVLQIDMPIAAVSPPLLTINVIRDYLQGRRKSSKVEGARAIFNLFFHATP